MRLTALEPLGQPGEEGAAGTELRVADTHPGAVADLIDLIEQVEDVEAQLHSLIEAGIDRLNHAEIDLLVARQAGPIRVPPGLVARSPLPAMRLAENKVRVVGIRYLIPAEYV